MSSSHFYPKANPFAVNDHKPWTLEEMQRVVDGDKTDVALSEELGRSEQAVQTKRHYIRKFGMPAEADRAYGQRHSVDTRPVTCCPGCHLALPATGVCDDCG